MGSHVRFVRAVVVTCIDSERDSGLTILFWQSLMLGATVAFHNRYHHGRFVAMQLGPETDFMVALRNRTCRPATKAHSSPRNSGGRTTWCGQASGDMKRGCRDWALVSPDGRSPLLGFDVL